MLVTEPLNSNERVFGVLRGNEGLSGNACFRRLLGAALFTLNPIGPFPRQSRAESVNQLDIPSLVSHSLVRVWCRFVRDCRIKFNVPGLKPSPYVQRIQVSLLYHVANWARLLNADRMLSDHLRRSYGRSGIWRIVRSSFV